MIILGPMHLPVGGRIVKVRGNRDYLVPGYIQRNGNNLHCLHGWQVRYKGSSAETPRFTPTVSAVG